MSLGLILSIVAVLSQSALGAKPVVRTMHRDGPAVDNPQKNVVRKVAVDAKGKFDMGDAVQAVGYMGCVVPSGWVRPYGNVAISAAGATDCQTKCQNGGYAYFGLECPMSTQVHCQCHHSVSGTSKTDAFCKGQGNPLVHAHNHCVGPYETDGYFFGDYSVGSVYSTSGQSPTNAPTTLAPTPAPTTQSPTNAPTTQAPTPAPTTQSPTNAPTTQAPTPAPTTQSPTNAPTTQAPTTPGHCQVTVYEHWPEGITAGLSGLEAAALAWGNNFPTGASMVLHDAGNHPLGALSNLTSSVMVLGDCCKAYGYTTADCSGPQGHPIESTTRLLPGLPDGIVTPATGLASTWGCNDCAQCVKITHECH